MAVSFIVRMFIESELKNCYVKTVGQKYNFFTKKFHKFHMRKLCKLHNPLGAMWNEHDRHKMKMQK